MENARTRPIAIEIAAQLILSLGIGLAVSVALTAAVVLLSGAS